MSSDFALDWNEMLFRILKWAGSHKLVFGTFITLYAVDTSGSNLSPSTVNLHSCVTVMILKVNEKL
jgi:hypothetical protein